MRTRTFSAARASYSPSIGGVSHGWIRTHRIPPHAEPRHQGGRRRGEAVDFSEPASGRARQVGERREQSTVLRVPRAHRYRGVELPHARRAEESRSEASLTASRQSGLRKSVASNWPQKGIIWY